MKRELVQSSDHDLVALLRRIGPVGLAGGLGDGPGFRVRFVGQESQQTVPVHEPARQRFSGCDLIAEVSLEFDEALGVSVRQVTLTNTGSEPTPPIRDLNAFYLPLKLDVGDQPFACSLGGGLTEGIYPPHAYRPERVCFGKARDWTPPNPSFTHWWVAQPFYVLESEPGGRSAVPYLPLILVGWNTDEGQVGLCAAMEWSGRWQMRFGAKKIVYPL